MATFEVELLHEETFTHMTVRFEYEATREEAQEILEGDMPSDFIECALALSVIPQDVEWDDFDDDDDADAEEVA